MIARLARLLEKADKLLDLRIQIAEQELKNRKAWPYPVDFYGPRGTEIRFPDATPQPPWTTEIIYGQ